MKRIYFPNLNGLRFIAALLVILHHIEQLKSTFGLENYWEIPFFRLAGKLGVVLFFVLSGFLITYLLLVEQKENKKISVKDFYIRRALRIWPLYFLIAILGLFVFPYISFLEIPKFTEQVASNFSTKVVLYAIFLPNVALVLFSPIPFLSQSWSIGVEEQFYLFWPLLIKKTSSTINALIGVILVYWSIRISLILSQLLFFNNYQPLNYVLFFLASFNIDCMAIGGIAAYFFFSKNQKILKFLFLKNLQISIYIASVLLILFGIRIPHPFYALLFSIIILNLATNPDTIISLENKFFHYLGKISYGLYMYHGIMIVIILRVLDFAEIDSGILLYVISLLLTILVSSFSYHFFEKKFIILKNNYAKILSGDSNKP